MTELERYEPGPIDLDLDAIRLQFAPQASRLELEFFAAVCRRMGLDPWAGQAYLIGRRQKVKDERGGETWKLVHKPQISVAGRRAIASRTGRLIGIDGPYWCGPRRFDAAGEKLPLEWTELWDDDDNYPYAARVFVWPAGWRTPANGTVKWSEFAVFDDAEQTKLGVFWRRSPSHMLGKVAESLALRRGFPEVEAAVVYAEGPGAGGFQADDAAMLAEAAAGAPALAEAQRDQVARAQYETRSSRAPARARDDGPPPEFYDALPEARGIAP